MLLRRLFFACLCLLAVGCPQPSPLPSDPANPPPNPPAAKLSSEDEFVEALRQAVLRGEFKTTDDFVLVAADSAKNLGLTNVKKLNSLQVPPNTSLSEESARQELASKLK